MRQLKPSLLEIDYFLLFSPLVLSIIGILFIYSSGVSSDGILFSSEYLKQIVWVSLGLVLLVLIMIFDYVRLKDISPYIFAFFAFLLVYTRFFGRVVNGSRSWVGIGEVALQPSEFMKIATILFLAKFLESSALTERPMIRFLKSLGIVLIPISLILLQPDFGTALVFFPIFLVMTYVAGIEKRFVVFTFITAALAMFFSILPLWQKYILKKNIIFFDLFVQTPYVYFSIGILTVIFILSFSGFNIFKKRYYYWIAFTTLILLFSVIIGFVSQKILKEYQIMRLIVFLDPKVDPKGSGWNIIQSVTAIGSGGFFGKGFLQGTQSHYRYLPQQSTDFIFSIISEEWGFLGGALIFSLFLILFLRGLNTIKSTRDLFGGCIAGGVTAMIFFHFFINVGMTMGIMPITGIPLFFLSYGGSALWTAMMGIGLILSVHYRRYRY